MALRIVHKNAKLILHWSSVQRLLRGPVQIHEGAIIVEIPDNCTHEQRLDYYEKARQIIAASK